LLKLPHNSSSPPTHTSSLKRKLNSWMPASREQGVGLAKRALWGSVGSSSLVVDQRTRPDQVAEIIDGRKTIEEKPSATRAPNSKHRDREKQGNLARKVLNSGAIGLWMKGNVDPSKSSKPLGRLNTKLPAPGVQ